jgi:putative tryptophan/tyrosine transport system substrate-binding protein
MRRRAFITLLGGAAAWPLSARAQQPDRLYRIGYLDFRPASQHSASRDAFRAGLASLGYIEGRNLQIEFRFAEGDRDRLPALATELVRLNVDLIVTYASGVSAAQRATATIPIVMATYTDAVAAGTVASLARPGGNITGSTFFQPELMAKRLELLKEIAPSLTRAGVFLFRGSEGNGRILETMGETAKTLAMQLVPVEAGNPTDLENAFSRFVDQKADALVVNDHVLFLANANAISALAARHRLVAIGPLEFAASGGLLAYGVSFPDQFRRAAVFVDKILKGTKPGDIPVEQATKFETIVNLTTAKALGVTLPTSILLRADRVIE